MSKPPVSVPVICLSGSEVSLSHSNMSESGKPSHANLPVKADKSHGGEFGYVGIDAILEQMRRKAMKQGFELNLMVVGTSDFRSPRPTKNKQMLTFQTQQNCRLY